jgi:hypothetical protein
MKSTEVRISDSLLAADILGSETPLVHSSLVVSKISSQDRDLGVDSLKEKKKITCMKKKNNFLLLFRTRGTQKIKLQRTVGLRRLVSED